jgi:alkylation response protein AidB-like acyl-CoA dehydrogenase
MTVYRAPLRDIGFLFEHVFDLAGICELPGFEHVDPGIVPGILEEAARFMEQVVAPTNTIGDSLGAVRHDDGSVTLPPEIRDAYAKYVAAGWNAVKGAAEYGGHQFPGLVALAVQEMMTTANMALSLNPMLTASTILALEQHGSEEQKAQYLEKLISGEWTGTMVLTEPQAGSDVGAITARAEPGDDGAWLLTGNKIFITWGEHNVAENIIHLVLARTPGAPPGTKGISLFLVPKFLLAVDGSPGDRNDITCVSLEHKIGIHASPTCVLAFGEAGGATGYLVGEEHQGMRAMFTMMNDARLKVGLEGLAVSERAFQHALEYAGERTQGAAPGEAPGTSSPIVDHPDVRRMLLTMKANTEAMRALMYATAAALDVSRHHPDPDVAAAAGGRAALLTPLAKAWGSDLGVEMTSLGIQVFGGMGYVEESGAGQLWRDSRIAPIYEGTNGIQAIDLVMRKLPMSGGTVIGTFLTDMEQVAAGLQLMAPTRSSGVILAEAIAVVAGTTAWLNDAQDPADRLAGATPYLRMLGTVAGGHYLGASALAAMQAGDDGPFLNEKVQTARFYMEQIVPQAAGLRPAVEAGAAALTRTPLSG